MPKLFTHEEYMHLLTAMHSGTYTKCTGKFYEHVPHTATYRFCVLGLAAHVNDLHVEYIYHRNHLLAEALTAINDQEDDQGFGRMAAWLEAHHTAYVEQEE